MNEQQKSDRDGQENVTPEVDPHTPMIELKRSSKNIRQPQRYSTSLYYILLTNRGEP